MIRRSESESVCVVISSSRMFPLEKTVAMEKYWLSRDFRFTEPPSGRLNSTAPSHWLITWKNASRLEMFFSFNFISHCLLLESLWFVLII